MSNIYHGQHIEQQPQQLRGLTVYLARLIGLTVILLVAGFSARGSTLIMATIADGPLYLWMRRIIRELIDMLPEERRNSPRIKLLAGWSCTTTMHLVEINARPIEGETNARDYDFSRAAVQTRWQAGYADTCRMLERRPWEVPIDPAVEVTVHESDAPATSHTRCYKTDDVEAHSL